MHLVNGDLSFVARLDLDIQVNGAACVVELESTPYPVAAGGDGNIELSGCQSDFSLLMPGGAGRATYGLAGRALPRRSMSDLTASATTPEMNCTLHSCGALQSIFTVISGVTHSAA